MTEKASGLRFDIYERIHLPEHMDGIERLDEIELTPHMELQVNSNSAVLKGHLQLSGTYVGTEHAEERQKLLHRIPVEISMPEERLVRDAELGVDIENFDVDLLSARTVNVTGVLSLKGVESISSVGRPNWQDESEMIFVQPPPLYPALEEARETAAETEEPVALDVRNTPQADEESAAQADQNSPQAAEETLRDEEELAQTEENLAEAAEDQEQESEASQELVDASPPGVKVAFASQPGEEPQVEQKQASLREAENVEELQESDEESAEVKREEPPAKTVDAEWKNLFLGQEETQQFRKVRMCIVQKEETLESIAERYELNPRELILYNRMTDQHTIEEGQVLYIPR